MSVKKYLEPALKLLSTFLIAGIISSTLAAMVGSIEQHINQCFQQYCTTPVGLFVLIVGTPIMMIIVSKRLMTLEEERENRRP